VNGAVAPYRFEERTLGARLVLLFFVLLLFVLLIPVFAFSQIRQDVTLSALGNFPFQSSGGDTTIDATNAGGGAVTYRLYFRTHSAIEGGYGYTHGTFHFAEDETAVGGGILSFDQGSSIHELTAAYVYHFWDDHRFKPFLLAGGGTVIFKPTGSTTANTLFGATTQARGAYLYGGGIDYHINSPFTLRLAYRALNFKAPDFFGAGLTTHSWMRTSAPTIGVAYQF
jgi:opacity protein-like surface antigen